MKAIIKILFIFWVLNLLVACAINQSADSKEAYEVEEEMASLESQLTGSTLPEENLHAFETRAIQKLYDWIDYLKLLRNSNYDSAMAKQIKDQAQALFIDHQMVSLELPPGVKIGKITTIAPLRQTRIGIYEGILSFTINEHAYKISILATRQTKQFGAEEMLVWEVFLGNLIE